MDQWDWQVAREVSPALLGGLWITIKVTLVGITLAMALGLAFALLRRSKLRIVSWPTSFVIEFIRSTPLLIQLFFLFFVMPRYGLRLDAFETGVLALGVHYATYTSEVYRSGIESVPKGQWEASTALSLSTFDTWTRVVLPQAVPRVIPALGNYLVAMFKDAPLLAVIALQDVLGEARRICSREFTCLEPYTLTGVYFLAVSVPAAIFVRLLEARYGRATA
jgi:polar amino acid transport system permease protein